MSRRRGFALAASYSFGMAVVYTAFGVFAGLAGEGLAAALQNPWVLGAFALGLVALSLSMFGVYELQLPSSLSRPHQRSAAQKLPGGQAAGVFAMGGVSALIVSPCVAAPLAGALLYLSQTRDVWLGGTALFSLAAGMSVPLLLVGASAGALLPRAGAWMVEVKAAFGVLLLGVALWTVQPILPGPLALALWGMLALGAAGAAGDARARASAPRALRPAARAAAPRPGARRSPRCSGWSACCRSSARRRARPIRCSRWRASRRAATSTRRPACRASSASRASTSSTPPSARAGRPVMLDFYADWCVSCKEMERFTFTDPAVQKKLAGALLLKADVTANNDDDRALLKRFQPVRAAGNDLLRRRRQGDSRGPADRLPEQPRLRRDPGQGRALTRSPRSRRVKLRLPVARWSSLVARWAHNPKVAGSNPALATTESKKRPSREGLFLGPQGSAIPSRGQA